MTREDFDRFRHELAEHLGMNIKIEIRIHRSSSQLLMDKRHEIIARAAALLDEPLITMDKPCVDFAYSTAESNNGDWAANKVAVIVFHDPPGDTDTDTDTSEEDVLNVGDTAHA